MDVTIETMCTAVAEMTKEEVKQQILHFDGPVPLDFTEDYLDSLNVDKLRHILLAAMLVAQRK